MAVLSPDLNVMMRAAEKAARSLIRDFGEVENLQVSRKGPADFVSAADKRAEEIIYTELKKTRPTFSFLMEESGEEKGEDQESVFIIDPLDGTTNFLHGLPHWAISIALQKKGETVAGVVYDPVKDEMFHAEKGGGAFIGRHRRLRVSGRNDPLQCVILCGQPPAIAEKRSTFIKELNSIMSHFPAIRRNGAAALDLAYIAAGRCDGYWEREVKEWDIAAGLLIVKEAGGFVSDLKGDTSKFKHPVLATNEHIHNEFKNLITKV